MTHTFIKSTLFFLGLMACSFASDQSPFHYDAKITETPDMHDVAHKVTMGDLEKAGYDLSKFTVTIQIPNQDKAIENFLRNRLFNGKPMSDDQFKIYSQNERLRQYILAFLKIESEAVFYRDLQTMMKHEHATLNSNELYQKHLSPNAKLVTRLFDITAGEDDKRLAYVSTMLASGMALRQGQYEGKPTYMFERAIFINNKDQYDPSIMLEKAKKVEEAAGITQK